MYLHVVTEEEVGAWPPLHAQTALEDFQLWQRCNLLHKSCVQWVGHYCLPSAEMSWMTSASLTHPVIPSSRSLEDVEEESPEFGDSWKKVPSQGMWCWVCFFFQSLAFQGALYIDGAVADDGLWSICKWVILLPLNVLLYYTIPDCKQARSVPFRVHYFTTSTFMSRNSFLSAKVSHQWLIEVSLHATDWPGDSLCRWDRWYMLTFSMAIVWIAVFSYIMVWMVGANVTS